MAAAVTKLVHYSGRVQGVGFRYTTMHVARAFDVVGYVKNLPDGRVEVLAQGDGREVQAFLDALERQMSGYIRDTQVSDTTAGVDYAEFRVAF
jgi:acylphosphatase